MPAGSVLHECSWCAPESSVRTSTAVWCARQNTGGSAATTEPLRFAGEVVRCRAIERNVFALRLNVNR